MTTPTIDSSRRRPLRIKLIAGIAALPVIALALAGCGGGEGNSTDASASPKTPSGQAATLETASEGNLGTILVDSQGRTLYLFQSDSGTKSACFGACASAWPPLRDSGKPTVGSGLNAALVGTTSRSDGMPQVTYNGHPLYLFQGDEKPGDIEGQGSTAFGSPWYALDASGNQVTAEASSSSSSSSSSGGGGYAY
jgi:predicted lipoprotein with Yx(FWY)xxD motif